MIAKLFVSRPRSRTARRTANCTPTLLLTDGGQRSDGVLPQPGDRGRGAAHAPLRHSRLRDLGAYRVRFGRAGARHGAEADSPRRRRLRAGRRLRFDDQPGRDRRLLPAVRALADNDTPQRASRPFDATRNGFLLGEGAGFLVLEEWEAARARGARIYAELAGDGNSLSSYRITDSPPDGDGPIQAMRAALADAGATPADIDYINAHGTSTG